MINKKNNVIRLPEGFWIRDKSKEDNKISLIDEEKIKQAILEDIKNKKLFKWLEDFVEDE